MMTPEPEAQLRQLWRDYDLVFTTEAGRRVLADLENAFYIHYSTASSAVSPSGLDTARILLNEGSRNVILRIHQMMRQASEPTPQPQTEEETSNG